MKTIVLNTLGDDAKEQIMALLPAYDGLVEIVDTSKMKIAHCVGCNQCWLRTPGVCAFKDDYEKIIMKLVEAENLWIVCDTRFGFLNYKGKQLMDRIVPMLNMTIGFRDGWMRHELRYHPLNIGLLYRGNADQELLEDWCKRTAVNIGGEALGAIKMNTQYSSITFQSSPLAPHSSHPSHLVIINGSPRTAKFSNTDKIIRSFVKGLNEEGISWELHNLSNRSGWDAAREAFMAHQHIIMAFPLYVECIPSMMLEFLDTLPTKREQPGVLSFILHGGMDEGNEFRLCERVLHELPMQLGCNNGGILIHGGSFRIRTTEGKERERMVSPYEKMGRLFAKKGNFLTPEARKFTGPEQYPWLVRKMVSLLFLKKVNGGFEQFAQNWGCKRPLNDKPYMKCI